MFKTMYHMLRCPKKLELVLSSAYLPRTRLFPSFRSLLLGKRPPTAPPPPSKRVGLYQHQRRHHPLLPRHTQRLYHTFVQRAEQFHSTNQKTTVQTFTRPSLFACKTQPAQRRERAFRIPHFRRLISHSIVIVDCCRYYRHGFCMSYLIRHQYSIEVLYSSWCARSSRCASASRRQACHPTSRRRPRGRCLRLAAPSGGVTRLPTTRLLRCDLPLACAIRLFTRLTHLLYRR